MRVVDARYPLRPEIIESAWYLHRMTKDPKYREMGVTFFEAIVADCRTLEGYTVLESVVKKTRGDLTPSYFFAETLKYLYLLFSDTEPPSVAGAVLSTEGHPLRRTW
jgi:mannosidase alpha-like ER degradation enhancer 2